MHDFSGEIDLHWLIGLLLWVNGNMPEGILQSVGHLMQNYATDPLETL